MEDYPEELRVPPVSLVSLIGCPDLHHPISAFLHSEQPPINTLALPDFSKTLIFARKTRDPLESSAAAAAPSGILKREWLLKHRTRVPAVVAAMFGSEDVGGDPAQWHQVCNDLDNLKALVRGRNIKLVVVLVLRTIRDDVSEDIVIALKKRAEVDSKHLVLFVQNDASELRESLNRLAKIFAELSNAYYMEEGRRIKARIDKKSSSYVELNIRYCFKVAVYAEFRRDWAEALRYYGDAYHAVREMVGTSTRLPPIQRLVEIKAMAEQLNFKVSTLLLHGGKVIEAINWFHKHVANYQRLVGSPEVAFLHWEWFSKQFLVFAELLETSSAAVPSNLSSSYGTSDNPLTEREFQPAYYYELSAHYLQEKRKCLDSSLPTIDLNGGNTESVIPSTYVGQYARLYEEGDTVAMLPLSDVEYTSYALSEGQRFHDSIEIIALFRRACESFSGLKAPRTASYCSSRMALEYFAAEDFGNAKKLLEGVAALYRQEGWVTLLWECLGYLRECSVRLGSAECFVQYSLEMAALPILSSDESETVELKKDQGPGGPASILQRKKLQEYVINLIRGDQGDCGLTVSKDQPLYLEIDLISPLRAALLASVAFHDSSVKPGSTTFITLSLLSQLPLPVEMNQLQFQFNQPNYSFKVVSATEEFSPEENQDMRVERVPSLVLTENKWLRLTFEIKPVQSGRLECLSVTAIIGENFKICCRAESAASMEDLPLWKFEDRVETFPTKDPSLAFSGQKFIQVEEPDPEVDLTLSAYSPALVGEHFIVPVSVVSKGHTVHSGELKINLVDARGDGLLMSPRDADSFSSVNHHVELLGISGKFEEEELEASSGKIKNIQQSFGVVSVPVIAAGESWSCKLEMKWHIPKSVMLYVSLGYNPNSSASNLERVNVHKSLQIEGQTPLVISHRIMMPFRREPLLLSKVKSSPNSDHKISLPFNEKSILVISARNCTEVPLRLVSISVDQDNDDDNDVGCSCTVSGAPPSEPATLVPGEEFKKVVSVTPQVDSPSIGLGTVSLKWTRDLNLDQNKDSHVLTKHKLPAVTLEKPPLVVSLECPPHVVLGVPFSFYIRVRNMTILLQEVKFLLGDSQSFVFAGAHNDSVSILPKTEKIINYKLVPLCSGPQQLPRITITSVRYTAVVSPSLAATTVFVYPSEPQFVTEEKRELEIQSTT